MIVSNLIGGLGNQMFQYACGRALSLGLGQDAKVFLGDFAGYRRHNGFSLSVAFKGDFQVAGLDELRTLVGWRAAPLARKALRHPALASLRGASFIVDPEDRLLHTLRQSTPQRGAFLSGYWQSERYFGAHAAQIRQDLRWRQPLVGANERIADLIRGARSASVHVRRGDYVNNAKALATHGVCPIGYYQRGASALAEDGQSRRWFVFSDDSAWAQEHLAPLLAGEVHVVDHNQGADSHFDMQLMSRCDDHIIANSSFSWWGAWLSTAQDKRVVAPKQWFAKPVDTADRCPPSWLRLG